MRKVLLLALSFFYASLISFSQPLNDTITKERVEKAISYLASDKLKGRVNYSMEQLEAARFISNEFASFGLQPFSDYENFYMPFSASVNSALGAAEVRWNNETLSDSNFYFFPPSAVKPSLSHDDFWVLKVYPPLDPGILSKNWNRADNVILQVILPDSLSFRDVVNKIIMPSGIPSSSVLLIANSGDMIRLALKPKAKTPADILYNLIGILPGKSKADEAIIFSAHYDHVDKGIYGESGGVYNGANDNASGTTAVLELARYFAMRNDNERTLIFCLFAGEELGLLGSKVFSNMIKPEGIKAVINIEMIGRTNMSGKNAFTVVGDWYSDLYQILRKNLKGEKIKALRQINDPANLFGRSDNFPFAQKGITAHTIMCSDDREPCYHKPCDDANRIDTENMTKVIRAIAKSVSTLISGADTPKMFVKGFNFFGTPSKE